MIVVVVAVAVSAGDVGIKSAVRSSSSSSVNSRSWAGIVGSAASLSAESKPSKEEGVEGREEAKSWVQIVARRLSVSASVRTALALALAWG